jgi:hypothetical protein
MMRSEDLDHRTSYLTRHTRHRDGGRQREKPVHIEPTLRLREIKPRDRRASRSAAGSAAARGLLLDDLAERALHLGLHRLFEQHQKDLRGQNPQPLDRLRHLVAPISRQSYTRANNVLGRPTGARILSRSHHGVRAGRRSRRPLPDLYLGEAVSDDGWDALRSDARNRLHQSDDRCQDSRRHFRFGWPPARCRSRASAAPVASVAVGVHGRG